MLPVPTLTLSAEDEEKLLSFLEGELSRLAPRRDRFHRKLRQWKKQYESVHEGESNFPWPKSANPKTGVTQYVTDTMHTVTFNVLKANRQPWYVETDDPDLEGITRPAEEILRHEALNERGLNLWPMSEPAMLERWQAGSGVVKADWEVRREQVRLYEGVPGAELKERAKKATREGRIDKAEVAKAIRVEGLKIVDREIVEQGPSVKHVPLIDFWYPLGYRNLQDMPWVAERFRCFGEMDLEEEAAANDWPEEKVRKVKDFQAMQGVEREELEESDRASGTEDAEEEAVTFFEFWLKFRFNRDPLTRDESKAVRKYKCWFHPDSRTILAVKPHPNNNGIWPYFDFHCSRRTDKWLSRGMCAVLESDEKEMNAIHKQRRDAATAANTVIAKARRDCGLDEETAELWPMKVLFMDDPKQDLIFETLGRELNILALIQEEETTLRGIERKTGLTEFNLGRDMGNVAKGRAAAASVMAQLRENLRRLSKVLDNDRATLSGMGMHILELYQQHRPFGWVVSTLGAEKGQALEEFFLLPQVPMRGRVFVRCTATDEVMNEEIRRQSILLVNGMMGAYYKQMTELVTMMGNPNAPMEVRRIAMAIADGANALMEEILESFHIRRRKELLVEFPKSFNDLSEQTATDMVKQMVNQLKGKGVPLELVDTRQTGQPTVPAAAPQAPQPIPVPPGPPVSNSAGGPPLPPLRPNGGVPPPTP